MPFLNHTIGVWDARFRFDWVSADSATNLPGNLAESLSLSLSIRKDEIGFGISTGCSRFGSTA